LLDAPLGLDREIRHVPIIRGWPDLSRITLDNPKSARFYVLGLDAFQIPVFEVEVRR